MTESILSILFDRFKLGLYELGVHGKIPKDELPKVLMAALSCARNQPTAPSITVDIRHVSEREELAYQIYKLVMSKHAIKTFYRGNTVIDIFCYDGGIYVPCEPLLRKEISELARESGEDVEKKTTRWVVSEVLSRIRDSTLTELRYEPLKIAFLNKGFDWEVFLESGDIGKATFDLSPEIVIYHRIPHKLNTLLLKKLPGLLKYDASGLADLETLASELCPKTLKAFKAWVGEKWPLLFEIIGYTMYPRYDLHKAVMLVGEGANGKSTYLRLIKKVLGNENVVSISLQELCENDFMPAQLYRKLANIYPDLPERPLRETGKFKVLTGEDAISANRKHRDPITFVNYAKLLFSTNKLPKVTDMTSAFWRRWLVIEFPNKFPPDPTFFERTFTEEEIEGLIIVSLIAFRNVWLRRKFSFEETEADYKEVWLRNSNSVYAFIKEGVEEGTIELDPSNADIYVEANELYTEYTRWCNENDENPVSKKAFTMELQRLFGIKKARKGGRRDRVYLGIRLVKKEEQESNLSLWKA